MKATVGDHLVIPGRHVNDRVRSGEIVEVHGPDGAPPYLVRWSGADEPRLIFPGPDARVEHGGVQDTADVGTVAGGLS